MVKHIIRLDFDGSSGPDKYTPQFALRHTTRTVDIQARAEAIKTVKRISSEALVRAGAVRSQGYAADGVMVYQKVHGPDMTFRIGFPYSAIDGPLFSSHDLTETQAVYMTMRVEQEMQKILHEDPEAQIEVVTVGYSRGGVSASIFQRNLSALYSDDGRVSARLLQVDPVSGGMLSMSKRMQAAFDVQNDKACHPQLVQHLKDVRTPIPDAPHDDPVADPQEMQPAADALPEVPVRRFATCSVVYSLNSHELSRATPERIGFIPQIVQGAQQVVLTDLGHESVGAAFTRLSSAEIAQLQNSGEGVFTATEISKKTPPETVLQHSRRRLTTVPLPEDQDHGVLNPRAIESEIRGFAARASSAQLTPEQSGTKRLSIIAGAVASVEHRGYRSRDFIDVNELHMNQAGGLAAFRSGARIANLQDEHDYSFSPSTRMPWTNGLNQGQIDDLDAYERRKIALAERLFEQRRRAGLIPTPRNISDQESSADFQMYKAGFVADFLANMTYEEMQSHCDLLEMNAQDFGRFTSKMKTLHKRADIEPYDLKADGIRRLTADEAEREFFFRCHELGKAGVQAFLAKEPAITEVLNFDLRNLPEAQFLDASQVTARYRQLDAMTPEALSEFVAFTREVDIAVDRYEYFGEISSAEAKLLRRSLVDSTYDEEGKLFTVVSIAVQGLADFDFERADVADTNRPGVEDLERSQHFESLVRRLTAINAPVSAEMVIDSVDMLARVAARKDLVVAQDESGREIKLRNYVDSAIQMFDGRIHFAPQTPPLSFAIAEKDSLARVLLKRPVAEFTSGRISEDVSRIVDICEADALSELLKLPTPVAQSPAPSPEGQQISRKNVFRHIKDFLAGQRQAELIQQHENIKELVDQWRAFKRDNPQLSQDQQVDSFASRAIQIIKQQKILEAQELAARDKLEDRQPCERSMPIQEYVHLIGIKARAIHYPDEQVTPELEAVIYENAFGVLPEWANHIQIRPERLTRLVRYPAPAPQPAEVEEDEASIDHIPPSADASAADALHPPLPQENTGRPAIRGAIAMNDHGVVTGFNEGFSQSAYIDAEVLESANTAVGQNS